MNLNDTLEALVSSMRLINMFFAVCFYRKALDNNCLNEVWLTAVSWKEGFVGVLSLAGSEKSLVSAVLI